MFFEKMRMAERRIFMEQYPLSGVF